MESIVIQGMEQEDASQCEGILRSLPDWFGIETAIVDYVHDLQTMETWVTKDEGRVIGFLTIKGHGISSGEIHVMAVEEDYHGCGRGRQLVQHVESVLRGRSVEVLQVKTLGPSRENSHYERTRGFYLRLGFEPLEENKLWGEKNPCLIMVKHLLCRDNSGYFSID